MDTIDDEFANNDELIKKYGEFILQFEFVCSWFRFSILRVLYPANNEKERNIVEIMTEGLTADPLRKKLIALIIEIHPNKSIIHDAANKISSVFSQFIELRNSFAHGTAFVGLHDFIQETKKGTIALRHPKLRKKGLDLNFKNYDEKQLQELISSLKSLQNGLRNLVIILDHPDENANFYESYIKNIYKELDSIKIN